MLRKLTWRLVVVPLALAALILILVVGLPTASSAANTIDAPSSESEPSAQDMGNDLPLLGCEEDVCVYLVDLPNNDIDCVLAIQVFMMSATVFDLECPGS